MLDTQQIYSFESQSEMQINCTQGALWITFCGDLQDYVLQSGEKLSVSAEAGKVVVEALQMSEFEVRRLE